MVLVVVPRQMIFTTQKRPTHVPADAVIVEHRFEIDQLLTGAGYPFPLSIVKDDETNQTASLIN